MTRVRSMQRYPWRVWLFSVKADTFAKPKQRSMRGRLVCPQTSPYGSFATNKYARFLSVITQIPSYQPIGSPHNQMFARLHSFHHLRQVFGHANPPFRLYIALHSIFTTTPGLGTANLSVLPSVDGWRAASSRPSARRAAGRVNRDGAGEYGGRNRRQREPNGGQAAAGGR